MIHKALIQQQISTIDEFIKNPPLNYSPTPEILLNEFILTLQFKPAVIPQLAFSRSFAGIVIDDSNVAMKMTYISDLIQIRALMVGVLNSRFRYNLRGIPKFLIELCSAAYSLVDKPQKP